MNKDPFVSAKGTVQKASSVKAAGCEKAEAYRV